MENGHPMTPLRDLILILVWVTSNSTASSVVALFLKSSYLCISCDVSAADRLECCSQCRTLPSYSDKPTPDLFTASLSPVISDEVWLSYCVLFVCRFWRFWEHQHQPVSVVSFTHIRQCSAHTFTSDDVFQAVVSEVQQLEELIGGR